MRMKAFLYRREKTHYNEGMCYLHFGNGKNMKIQRRHKIGISFFLLLAVMLTGCTGQENSVQKQEEAAPVSMEEEPDLNYEIPVSVPGILVDQLGYIKEGTKIAVFCGNEVPEEFYVVNQDTGEVVYTGFAEEKEEQKAGEKQISYGDFSDFQVEVTYYLETAALGRSYYFTIKEDLYGDIFREAFKQYYYNRCGMTLTREYAGDLSHNACHTGKAVLREDVSAYRDVSGGWHQDQNGSKNVVKAAKSMGIMLLAYELYGDAFGDDMEIPESGNGIPDLLDEMRYETEWLLKMQEAQTGAVYQGVTMYQQGTYIEPPDMETAKAFAMVLAKFSYLYQSYDEEYATECLKVADRAFQYARLNDSEKDQEDPFYFAAAAELYRASGQQYLYTLTAEYLEQTLMENKEELDDITFLGYVTYISTKQRVDLNDCEKITKILMEQAEEVSDLTRENPYLVSSRDTSDHMELLDHVMKITMVNYMIANHEYETVIENHLHYFLGRNEQAICYLDHVGQKNYSQINEGLGIMNQFEADSKLIFVLSEIVCTYGS